MMQRKYFVVACIVLTFLRIRSVDQYITNQPRVKVSIVLMDDGKILLGKRSGVSGLGAWALPGAYLNFKETFVQCAERSAAQSLGFCLSDFFVLGFTEDISVLDNKHDITIYIKVQYSKVAISALSSDEWDGWFWLPLAALPEALREPLSNFLLKV